MKCPFSAVWDGFTPDGKHVEKELYPEDVISMIAEGFGPDEISKELDAPVEVVEHVICMIPEMMAWRRMTLSKNKMKRALPKVMT